MSATCWCTRPTTHPDEYADLMERILHCADLRPIGRYRDWLADTQIFQLQPD